jgi:hypothetical protein
MTRELLLRGSKTAPEFSEKFLELPGSSNLASAATQGVKLRLVGLVPVVVDSLARRTWYR